MMMMMTMTMTMTMMITYKYILTRWCFIQSTPLYSEIFSPFDPRDANSTDGPEAPALQGENLPKCMECALKRALIAYILHASCPYPATILSSQKVDDEILVVSTSPVLPVLNLVLAYLQPTWAIKTQTNNSAHQCGRIRNWKCISKSFKTIYLGKSFRFPNQKVLACKIGWFQIGPNIFCLNTVNNL